MFCNFHFSDDQSRWQLLEEGQIIAHFLGRSYDLHIYFGIFCTGCADRTSTSVSLRAPPAQMVLREPPQISFPLHSHTSYRLHEDVATLEEFIFRIHSDVWIQVCYSHTHFYLIS